MGVGSKNDPTFFWIENLESFGFLKFELKKCFRVPTPWVCMGRSGMGADAGYAMFCHFCHVGAFGNLDDPVLPTLRGVSGDGMTIYAY